MRYTQQDVLDNLGLVHTLAYVAQQKFTYSRLGFDDFVNEGIIGLMKALEVFDPERGAKISTYARHRILGSMMDAHQRADKQYWAAHKRGDPLPVTVSLEATLDSSETYGDRFPGQFFSEDEMIAGIDREKNWKAIWKRLKPTHRVVVKSLLSGSTQKEIAEDLGLSTGTVSMSLTQIRMIANRYHFCKETA